MGTGALVQVGEVLRHFVVNLISIFLTLKERRIHVDADFRFYQVLHDLLITEVYLVDRIDVQVRRRRLERRGLPRPLVELATLQAFLLLFGCDIYTGFN
mmetsp:Transcript_19997/g.30760  ORF Transcript_19997/g.30760 Transcript_19997/m.30760 type:complete len:99 (+) Transcript_19997:79-375(+)